MGHIDSVKAMYAAFGQGDIPAILSRLSPDVEWEYDWQGPTLRWYEPRRGRAEVVKFFETLADFDFVRFEPQAFLAGEDMIAVPIQIELVHKATGRRVRDCEAHLWTFGADGLVTRFRHLVDTRQYAALMA
ncbi:nuclear transport factor 2 family protein [Terrarubrum flagellatum]|uniref:nuclear transport factor 2 family protein n=1 Tax=Terrirubrum flagellatum TaxID=2895980 RepID=UPI003145118D